MSPFLLGAPGVIMLVAPLMQIMQSKASMSVSEPLNGSHRQEHARPLSRG